MSKIIYILLVSTVVTAVLYGLYSNNVKAQTANIQYNVFIKPELYSRSWVVFTLFTEIIENGLQYNDFLKLKNTIACESGYNVNAIGDSGKAVGLAQFWYGTFEDFKKEASFLHFDRDNPEHQIKLIVWAYKNNKMSHWTCFRNLYKYDEKHL